MIIERGKCIFNASVKKRSKYLFTPYIKGFLYLFHLTVCTFRVFQKRSALFRSQTLAIVVLLVTYG